MQIRTLFLVIFLSPLSAIANWEFVSKSYRGDVYIDQSVVNEKDSFTFVWQLQNFKAKDKRGIKSRRILNKVDCRTKQRKIMYSSSYSEHMGKGVVLISGEVNSEWSEPLPKSVGARVIAKFCG